MQGKGTKGRGRSGSMGGTLQHGAGSPPAGSKEWVKYQEAEYKFFEHHSTWVQAQRICSWFQAELVSVHGEAELRFLGQNLKKVRGGGDLPGCTRAQLGAASRRCSVPTAAPPGTASSVLCLKDGIWGQPGSKLVAGFGAQWLHREARHQQDATTGHSQSNASGRGAAQPPLSCPMLQVAVAVPREMHRALQALTSLLWSCSSPGARSSTGGSGCTPTRTTGGSSKSGPG